MHNAYVVESGCSQRSPRPDSRVNLARPCSPSELARREAGDGRVVEGATQDAGAGVGRTGATWRAQVCPMAWLLAALLCLS